MPAKRSSSKKRSTKKSRKKSTTKSVKTIKRIAKSVHFSNTERKWKGIESTNQLQPELGTASSTFLQKTVLVLPKGDDSQTRNGRQVQALGVQQILSVSSTMDRPLHFRILLLQTKKPDTTPAVDNIIINVGTKAPQSFSQIQQDIYQKINTDLWTKLLDKRYIIMPRGEATGTPAPLVGLSHWSRTINIYKKHFHKINYDLDTVGGTNTPAFKNLFWVYVIAFPNGGPLPPATDPGRTFDMTIQQYYYFKDI